MEFLDSYHGYEVYWADYSSLVNSDFDKSNWVCLAISNDIKPNFDDFELLNRKLIKNGVFEFKGQGRHGELLHNLFDETIVTMEVLEKHPELQIMTTWHNDERLADAFWQFVYLMM